VTCFNRWRQCSREEKFCPPSANVRICNSVSRLPSSSLGLGGRSLGHLRNIKNLALGELPLAGGLVLLLAASMLWRAFPMALTGAGLVLILQEVADPSPLFFTVPWEALEFVLSRKVRANHFWLHRTQGLLRESGDSLAKIDGCATRDGFFLGSCDRLQDDAVSVCSMVNRWRLSRANPARPAAKALGSWIGRVARSDKETWPNRLEVERLAIPRFLWFKSSLVFRVRRMPAQESSEG